MRVRIHDLRLPQVKLFDHVTHGLLVAHELPGRTSSLPSVLLVVH